ncbi:hypothetical protein C4D60_Mb00t19270 [Musa balbisiana]|uniref:Uncharacterized protein n=1 Tax=Musa balbisiana TaxID=52838 RepID=A0A4S8I5E9_MUSBA|nr:hypothetical protein C4D60_Mb00t19270 [Musa balbisiana]
MFTNQKNFEIFYDCDTLVSFLVPIRIRLFGDAIQKGVPVTVSIGLDSTDSGQQQKIFVRIGAFNSVLMLSIVMVFSAPYLSTNTWKFHLSISMLPVQFDYKFIFLGKWWGCVPIYLIGFWFTDPMQQVLVKKAFVNSV